MSYCMLHKKNLTECEINKKSCRGNCKKKKCKYFVGRVYIKKKDRYRNKSKKERNVNK